MTEPVPVRSTGQRPDERVVVVVVAVHEPERDRAAERSGFDTPDPVPGLATPAPVPPYTVRLRSRGIEPADVPNAQTKVSMSPPVTATGNGTVMKTRPVVVVVVVVVGRIAAAARSAAGAVAVGSAVA